MDLPGVGENALISTAIAGKPARNRLTVVIRTDTWRIQAAYDRFFAQRGQGVDFPRRFERVETPGDRRYISGKLPILDEMTLGSQQLRANSAIMGKGLHAARFVAAGRQRSTPKRRGRETGDWILSPQSRSFRPSLF
ncbi:MAG: hypothetical protein M0Z84_11605 [Gammaproteobacteria bacterium]|nr:hypothetical protein [Gammaproteobacteria bacterium]